MANAQSVVIDHQNLGAHLAEGFKTGNSLIENEQRHPPAVGIPTQRQVTPGQKNFATLSRADMYERDETVKAAEITASAGNSAEDRSSRRLRNEWGKPRMTRDIELTTLEQVVVRGHVNKVEAETGRDMGPMRFGTTKEVAAVNLAHGGAYKPSDRQHLRRDQDGNMPGGVTVDLAKPDDGMFRARETVLDENNNAKRDSRGGVVERIVERQRTTNDPAAPERRPKTLYHVDDLRVDSRPGRVWTPQNHDEKGKALIEPDAQGNDRPARTPSGSLVRTEDGSPRRTNHDASGKSIDDRVGGIQRDAGGEVVMVSVEKLSDREPAGHQWGMEQTEVAIRGKAAEGNRRARPGIDQRLAEQGVPPINITTTNQRGVSSSSFSVSDDGVPTITHPAKFKNADHELTERTRVVAHAEQWTNPGNPNHDNARKAAVMKPAERQKSPEYAACELTAQHAAMAAVTRAGGTYQPQPKAANEKLREHWAKQVSTPEGLDQFGRSTDMARRVCDGKQPERNRSRERRSNRASDQIEDHARTQQARSGPQQSRSGDLSDLMQSKPVVRGQGRPAGGAAPAAPAAPEKGQKRD